MALHLNLAETDELLKSAGFTLSHSLKQDLVVEYFIGYKLDKDGDLDLTLAGNREFANGLLSKTTNANDLNAYIEGDTINEDGIRKVERALISAAYKADKYLNKLFASRKNNVRNITQALLNAAPNMAAMNVRIANGSQEDFELAKHISDAVKKISSLRESGQPINNYLQTQQFENDEYSEAQTQDSPVMREILAGLEENKGNVKDISDFLKRMVNIANEQGNKSQLNMFGESEKMSAEDIVKSARKDINSEVETFEESAEEQAPKEESTPVKEKVKSEKKIISEEELLKGLDKALEGVEGEEAQYEAAKKYLDDVIENTDEDGAYTAYNKLHSYWMSANSSAVARGTIPYTFNRYNKWQRDNIPAGGLVDSKYEDRTAKKISKAEGMLNRARKEKMYSNKEAYQMLSELYETGEMPDISEIRKKNLDNSSNNTENESNNDILFEVSDDGVRNDAGGDRGREKIRQVDRNEGQGGIRQTGAGIVSRYDERGTRGDSGSNIRAQGNNEGRNSVQYKDEEIRNPEVRTVRDLIEKAGIEVITDPAEVEKFWKENKYYSEDKEMPSAFVNREAGQIFVNINHSQFQNNYRRHKQSLIHEYTHIWDKVIELKNPELWKRGVELMKTEKTDLWNKIKKRYLKEGADYVNDDNLLASEMHAALTGDRGAKAFNNYDQDRPRKLLKWIRDFWQKLKDVFSQWLSNDAKKMSLDDFINAPLNDLIHETNLKEKLDKIDVKEDTMFELSDDNSNESFGRKVLNYFASRNDLNERQRKLLKRKVEEFSGWKIAFGHLDKNSDVLVKEADKLIRTREQYDWKNILPVIGKEAAKQLNIEPTDNMGNYIADWLLTGAPNNRTAEAETFEKAMRDNPAKEELLTELRFMFHEINNLPAFEKAKMILRSETPKKSVRTKLNKGWDEFITAVIDDLHPVDKFVKEIEKAANRKIPESINPYRRSRMYKGARGIAEAMIEADNEAPSALKQKFTKNAKTQAESAIAALKGELPTIDWNGFKPLKAILNDAGGFEQQKDFEAYLLACHVKDMHIHNANSEKAEDMKTPLTEKECDEIIAQGKDRFGQAQKDLVRYAHTLWQIQYQSGIISKEKYRELSKWKNFVPINEIFEENEDLNFNPNAMKKVTGASGDVYSPIQTLIHNTVDIVKRAEKNKIKCSFANLARCGAVGKLIEEVDNSSPQAKKTITFYEGGKRKYLYIEDADVAKAINEIDNSSQSHWIMKMLHAAVGWVRALITGRNPDFAAGNIFRDAPDAFIHNKYNKFNPFLPIADLYRGLGATLFKTDDFYEYLAHGGAMSSLVSPDIDYTKKYIDDVTKTTKQRLFSGPLSAGRQILSWLQWLSETSEHATRVGTYMRAKKALAESHEDKQATFADKKAAAFMARDATLDFAKAGKATREVNKHVAFFNAAIQGFNRTARTLDPRKLKTEEGRTELAWAAVRYGLYAMLPAIICWAMNHDKDWYKNIPEYEKGNNWIIAEGFKIPKGMDLGIRLISNGIEEFLNSAYKKEPFKWESIKQPFKNALPDFFPTLMKPLWENATNYDTFREKPIVPISLQHDPEKLQYNTYTSSLSKAIGEITGYSPMKLDHLIYGYTGYIGRLILQNRPYGWTLDTFPMVRRFSFDPYKNPKQVSDYYNEWNRQSELKKEYEATKKKPEEFNLRLYNRMKNGQEKMRNFSKREKAITDNPKLTAEQRREQIHRLNKERIAYLNRMFEGAK